MKKFLFVLLSILWVCRVEAVKPEPYTEPVSFAFLIGGTGNGIMTVYSEPGDSVGQTTSSYSESDTKIAWMRPGRAYWVNYQASGAWFYALSFKAPTGYAMYINGQQRDYLPVSTGGGWYSHDYLIELKPIGGDSPQPFGSFSGIRLGKSVAWSVGLGGLRTGRSAGTINFREPDLTGTPAARSKLFYSAPANAAQITIYGDGPGNQTLRQVVESQGLIDLTDDTNGYWLKFYSWSQATWGGSLYSFSGSPWKTIRVESPGSNQLKITDTEGGASRVSQLSLVSGSVSSGAFEWQLQEGDGSNWLRTTTHTSTTLGGFSATGGSMSTSGGYTIHAFTSSGTFAVSSVPSGASVEYLVVAGGGGGGGATGGGGGAGGFRTGTLSVAAQNYSITVGAGGAGGGSFAVGGNGGNSVFSSITATGGGGGGYNGSSGSSGGSGGGAGHLSGSGGNGTSGQGNNGGIGGWDPKFPGGGGGGAGGAGANATNTVGGNGGAGAASSITGSSLIYAAGGGGGVYLASASSAGTGGSGVGGNGGGSDTGPTAGAANRGSGGGGCGNNGSSGAAGGSGIVVIRYATTGGSFREVVEVVRTWDPLESTCRHASLSIL